MRISALALHEIIYTTTTYETSLYESICRRGLAFPLKVKKTPKGYICVDGHKRLSVLQDIPYDMPAAKWKYKIPVVLVNTSDNRSSDCWRGRNTH